MALQEFVVLQHLLLCENFLALQEFVALHEFVSLQEFVVPHRAFKLFFYRSGPKARQPAPAFHSKKLNNSFQLNNLQQLNNSYKLNNSHKLNLRQAPLMLKLFFFKVPYFTDCLHRNSVVICSFH